MPRSTPTESPLTQTGRYPYQPLPFRRKLTLPRGARVALVVYSNIEHFPEDLPGTPIVPMTARFTPDVLNYGWRDYGNRVGQWRLFDMFDRLKIRSSVCLNGDVCREYPEIIEAGNARGWEWMGHGQNNSRFLNDIDEATERAMVRDVIDTIARSTGKRPKGWLGPFLAETFRTPDILAEAGIEYLCDFTADDHPFPMTVATGSLLSMPYSVEMNDLPAFLSLGLSASAFADQIVDQFEVLYREGADNARVMPLCLHNFLVGQAFRAKHLERALEHIVGHDKVWLATAGEINDWYRKTFMA